MTKKAPRQAKDSMSITRSQPFAAHIVNKDGEKARLVVDSKAWFQHQLNKFKDGESVTLEIHNRRAKRTEAQNRYIWGVFYPLIAKETGEQNLDRLHELFKGMFLSEGVVDVLGKKVRMKKSTTELGVGEFCEFVMAIEAETGIEAPPTENWELAPLRASIGSDDRHETDSAISEVLPAEQGEDSGEGESIPTEKPRANKKKRS